MKLKKVKNELKKNKIFIELYKFKLFNTYSKLILLI